MAEKRNQEIRDFCEWDYPRWLYSRSKYAQQLPLNILAQFMPSKSSIERDYENSQFCAAFHLALMFEIDRDIKKATCFLYVFFPRAKPAPLKTLAYDYGIHRETAFEWAHQTAENIFRLAKINCKLNTMINSDNFKL